MEQNENEDNSGSLTRPSILPTSRCMTTERLLFVLENVRCLLAAASHRLSSKASDVRQSLFPEEVRVAALDPASGSQASPSAQGGLGMLFDEDSFDATR